MKRFIYAISLLCGLLLFSCSDDFSYYTVTIENPEVVSGTTEASIRADIIYRDQDGRIQSSGAYGTPTIEYYGVYYSTTNRNPGKNDTKVEVYNNYLTDLDKLEVDLSNLHSNSGYYARLFLRNATGEVTSNVFEFETYGGSGGGGGSSSKGANVSDFVGTYSLSAYNVDEKKYVSWDNVKIYTFENSNTGTDWVAVYGLDDGDDYALGEHDATNKAIRLYSGWAFTDVTFTLQGKGDTLFIARFYPVYTSRTFDPWHVITDGAGYDGSGEAWLTFDNSGKLKFGGAATADSEGYRANGYDFAIHYKESGKQIGWFDTYLEVELTKTSNSTSAPARVPQAIEWHAPMVGDTPYKVRNSFVPGRMER